jgi:hypothetical protein
MAKKSKPAKSAKTESKGRTAPAKSPAAPPAAAKDSKTVAVNLAVRHQLEVDGHWRLAHDETKVMGADYHYDEQSMRQFLHAVHRSLAASKPTAYTFMYDAQLVTTALEMKGPALIAAINDKTTPDATS